MNLYTVDYGIDIVLHDFPGSPHPGPKAGTKAKAFVPKLSSVPSSLVRRSSLQCFDFVKTKFDVVELKNLVRYPYLSRLLHATPRPHAG